MDNSEIALQLTLKAMEEGLIPVKKVHMCESNNPFEEANQFAAKQVNEFYTAIVNHLFEL